MKYTNWSTFFGKFVEVVSVQCGGVCSLLKARLSTVNAEYLHQKKKKSKCAVQYFQTYGCSSLFCLDVSIEMHLFCKISHPVDIIMQNHKLFNIFFSKLCY